MCIRDRTSLARGPAGDDLVARLATAFDEQRRWADVEAELRASRNTLPPRKKRRRDAATADSLSLLVTADSLISESAVA